MDEKSLNELLECSVCLERLDASSKVLPCQHTFCRWCLEEIVTTKQELRCPECRYLVEIDVQELPSNILLVRILEGMKNAVKSSGSSAKSSPSRASERTGSYPSSPARGVYAEGGSHLSPSHKTLDISNQPRAKSLYNYDATETGDLSFKKSDIILLRKQVDENWYHGELNGQHGFFPSSYVQVIQPLPNKEIPSCKALYDFTPDQHEKDCLTFQKDETVTVIRRVDDNWLEGKLQDCIGIFPTAFVELNDAAKLLINFQASQSKSINHTNDLNKLSRGPIVPSSSSLSVSLNGSPRSTSLSSQSPDPPSPPSPMSRSCPAAPSSQHTKPYSAQLRDKKKRHSLTTLSPVRLSPRASHRHSAEVTGVMIPTVNNDIATQTGGVTPQPRGNETTSDIQSQKASLSIYTALYNYKPQKDDELELMKGGFYSVKEKCQDGWFKGICVCSGKQGVFPGNYVQPAKSLTKSNGIGVSRSSGAVSSTPTLQTSSTTATGTIISPKVAALSSSAARSHRVSRTHSFPKTSPLASMRQQGVSRPPNVNPGHPRPITNITQAQIRSTQTNAATAQSRSHSMLITTNSSYNASTLPQGENSSDDEDILNKTQSLPLGLTSNDVFQPNQNGGLIAPLISVTTNSHSPRSSRKSLGDKSMRHSLCQGKQSKISYVGSSPVLHPSMSTNVRVTPPNVVIGAAGGIIQQAGGIPHQAGASSAGKEKEVKEEKKEKKKEKDRLPVSLMKKLSAGIPVRMKKSRSPVTDRAKDKTTAATDTASLAASPPSAVSLNAKPATQLASSPSSHHRSELEPTMNATAAHPKKSSSLGSSTQHGSTKPAKVKPLVRERYQCIVPYPPQGDIELELKMGDLVYVHKKRDDGWFKGTLLSTGKTGLFPGNFVEKC